MKNYRLYCNIIILLLTSLSSFSFADIIIHTDISVADANEMIQSNPDLIIIDVREESTEYCPSGHIPGALNYPYISGYFGAHYTDFAIDDEILIICKSGGRSNAAATILESNGYLYVYDMLYGMNAWTASGYITTTCIDTDIDGINDDLDNCPEDHNPSQVDSDNDNIGNACDSDCPNLDLQNPVNLNDLAFIAMYWNEQVLDIPEDLNNDNLINIEDLLILASYWLSNCYEI